MDFGAEPTGPEVLLDKTLFYLSAFSKRLGSPDLTLLVYKHQENDTHFSALEIKPQKCMKNVNLVPWTGRAMFVLASFLCVIILDKFYRALILFQELF